MWLALSSLATLALGAALHTLYARSRKLRGLPGPTNPSFFFGNTVDLRRAPTGTRWKVWQRAYGATYKITGPLLDPILVLGDPRGATYVLSANVANYPRTELDRTVLEGWFGPSLFSADGDEHRAMRKMLSPAFTQQSVKEVSPTFFDLAQQVITDWKGLIISSGGSGAVLDVRKSIGKFSLDAISSTMFACNISVPAEGQRSIPAILDTFSSSDAMTTGEALAGMIVSAFPSLLKLPNPMKTAARDLRAELTRIARDVWAADSPARVGDARILEMMDKRHSQGMSEEEAIAQIVALLFAGSETTVNLISEVLYELALNPKVQHHLCEELNAVKSIDGGGSQLAYDRLMSAEHTPYLDAVLREGLRLKAVLMDISRCAISDDEIPLEFPLPDGTRSVRIRAGQDVSISVREGLNINPDIWGPDAEQFLPERWLDGYDREDRRALIRAQSNMMSFGDGPRVCLGRSFAIAESKILIAALVTTFSFEPADDTHFSFYHLGGNTIKPKVDEREDEGVQLPLKVSVLGR